MADLQIDSGQNSEMPENENVNEEEDFSCENFHDGQVTITILYEKLP